MLYDEREGGEFARPRGRARRASMAGLVFMFTTLIAGAMVIFLGYL